MVEYEDDALASNSEDEKRMEKAVTCFHCGLLGHFRRKCPKALASVPYPLISVNEHRGW